MLIDTHSHISFKSYDADREEVIKRCQQEGLVCIDVGTKYETSKRAIELAEKNEGIYAAIGMHPIHIKTDLMKLKMDEDEGAFEPLGEEYDKARYKDLVLRSQSDEGKNKIVAIGEIGLDYYYRPKGKTKTEQFKQNQREIFIKQLELAEELNLPVIVHCRVAHNDLYEILKNRKLRGVIHCFTGSLEDAKKYIDLGFYIGVNGIIFKFHPHTKPDQDGQIGLGGEKSGSGVGVNLDEVVKSIPLDKILIETDCPYLTPPKAGVERNEPIFVKYVAERIAELKNITFGEVAKVTTENAMNLFGIQL
jgi:TatD DNase family protein